MTQKEKIGYLLLCFIIGIYLGLRAYFIPIAHDEAATFFFYVQNGKFLPFLSQWDANNHILNSALTSFFHYFFGSSPFVLRLGNLLFVPVLFLYVYKFANECVSVFIRWLLIVLLLCSNSFIEWLAMSRGYGMSMALFLAALWYCFLFMKEMRIRNLVATLILLMFATSANLILIYSYAIISAILGLKILINGKKKTLLLSLLLSLTVFPAYGFALYAFALKEKDLLYYGSDEGFIPVTLKSLLKMIYGTDNFILMFGIIGLFILLFSYFFIGVTRNRNAFLNEKNLFIEILSLNIVSVIVLNLLFGINFPEDRTGIYLYPLICLSLAFSLEEIKNATVKISFSLPVSGVIIILFIIQANMSYHSLWKVDHVPASFYNKILKTSNGNQICIGGYHMRNLVWAFYNYQNNGKLNLIHYTDYPSSYQDYQIMGSKDAGNLSDEYERLDYDAYSDLHLLKRKTFLQRKKLFEKDSIETFWLINDEFFTLMQGECSTLKSKQIFVSLKGSLKAEYNPFKARMIVAFNDSSGTALRYEYLPFDWLRKEWKEEAEPVNNSIFVHNIPKKAKSFIVYIWNVNKQYYKLDNGKIEIFELKK